MSSLPNRMQSSGPTATASQTAPAATFVGPYAKKWKEFDRLQSWTSTHWIADGLVIFVSGIVVAGIGDANPTWHRPLRIIESLVLIALALFVRRWSVRLEHWPCPRCGTEWPGEKTKKAEQCAMCGLKLHQMAP